MPTGLLNLSNELIQHIGFFSHGGIKARLPSFGTHVENYRDPFDPACAVSYNHLRATCKRIHQLLPLRALHVELRWGDQVNRWKAECPLKVLRTVTRLRINFPGPDDNGDQIRFNWLQFLVLLHRMPNLLELILADNCFCDHEAGSTYRPQDWLFLPRKPPLVLKQLRCFSNQLECTFCSYLLNVLFAVSPNIGSLRCTEPSVNSDDDYVTAEVPLLVLDRLSDMVKVTKRTRIHTLVLGIGDVPLHDHFERAQRIMPGSEKPHCHSTFGSTFQ
ncbi:hypothetical protein CI109_104156 [Kwoniella shandongensis]|uniref:Uncharacterized protein n=1 Tax=Kwoniella shandongensis TaxID=1734106 RepID=A0A5M6C197_9TREE|nr:uncharacterized protein CI109_002931 [Kwoniella shandongensis]KAA5528773.1 hypothetical protein CI109_002931 [Kwoniella shandongensis]